MRKRYIEARISTQNKLELWLLKQLSEMPRVLVRPEKRTKNIADYRVVTPRGSWPLDIRIGWFTETRKGLEIETKESHRYSHMDLSRRGVQRFCLLATNSGISPSPSSLWVVDMLAFHSPDHKGDVRFRNPELIALDEFDCPFEGSVANRLLWAVENVDLWREHKAVRIRDGRLMCQSALTTD